MCICVYVCICVCEYVDMCVCVYVCMCVCVYVCLNPYVDIVRVLVGALTALDLHTEGELTREFAAHLSAFMIEELEAGDEEDDDNDGDGEIEGEGDNNDSHNDEDEVDVGEGTTPVVKGPTITVPATSVGSGNAGAALVSDTAGSPGAAIDIDDDIPPK
jgi:hypothetical protein